MELFNFAYDAIELKSWLSLGGLVCRRVEFTLMRVDSFARLLLLLLRGQVLARVDHAQKVEVVDIEAEVERAHPTVALVLLYQLRLHAHQPGVQVQQAVGPPLGLPDARALHSQVHRPLLGARIYQTARCARRVSELVELEGGQVGLEAEQTGLVLKIFHISHAIRVKPIAKRLAKVKVVARRCLMLPKAHVRSTLHVGLVHLGQVGVRPDQVAVVRLAVGNGVGTRPLFGRGLVAVLALTLVALGGGGGPERAGLVQLALKVRVERPEAALARLVLLARYLPKALV
ncbi:hypothetical protein BpHYR1_027054 [Brachionus plicatilis]|uniref:Uncharacterized protein n=1 Tax=Brachionus plicatilis TaxID=10195 RepID=A0A3M7Q7M8_BRAPC|nr:hypothetical protein BpHYR1_027054 [Brachionus plicatilis]